MTSFQLISKEIFLCQVHMEMNFGLSFLKKLTPNFMEVMKELPEVYLLMLLEILLLLLVYITLENNWQATPKIHGT